MSWRLKPAWILTVVLGGLAAAHAGETTTEYGLGLVTGIDTNPLELSTDDPSGLFTRLGIDGRVDHWFTDRTALYANGFVSTKLHAGSAKDANVRNLRARVGFLLAPTDRIAIAIGGRYGESRGTFVDPETGESYQVNGVPLTDPATPVSIADRLDENTSSIFTKLRWRTSPRLRWLLDAASTRKNYVDDYGQTTDLESLDYDSLTLEPGVGIRVSESVDLDLRYVYVDLSYDDRIALDKSGSEVPGVTREYRYSRFRFSFDWEPSGRWSFGLGHSGGQRDDRYEGYYDRETRVSYVSADRRVGENGTFRFYGNLREVSYDTATVTGAVDGEIRGSDVVRLLTRYQRDAGKDRRWYFEVGSERSGNEDPIYRYDREWILTGVNFRR